LTARKATFEAFIEEAMKELASGTDELPVAESKRHPHPYTGTGFHATTSR
jgi:hypothetical protein